MNLPGRRVLLAVAFCATAAVAGLARRAASRDLPPTSEEQLDLPVVPTHVLKPLSFGLRSLYADLFFLDAVQINGARSPKNSPEKQLADDRAMARQLAKAVALDPGFAVAYRFAGNAMPRNTLDGKAYNVLAAVPILEQGVRECPDDWKIPFLLGFYDSFYLGKMADAAQNMAIAARRPGVPAYVGLLATRLAADADDLRTAERMAIALREQADSDEARAQWETRILDLQMERDLRAIELAAQHFRERTGSPAPDLRALVRAGELGAVPTEPHGGRYELDPRTGEARSTRSARLRVRGRYGTTSGLEVH